MSISLDFKGDVKRETRWLAQYGQVASTITAALLVWRMDTAPERRLAPVAVVAASSLAGLAAFVLKRLVGRVRPGRPQAGRFLGPSLKHENYRESFPSSHSACAVGLSAALASLYPQGAVVFWALAVTCAILRYLLDAHWPSDVLGGAALGYGMAHLVMRAFSG